MTPETINSIQNIGIPFAILIALAWAAWKWIPKVAKWVTGLVEWGKGIVDRLTASNEMTGKAVLELTSMHSKDALVGASLQRGQRLLGLIHLAVAENRMEDAKAMSHELQRLHQQQDDGTQ